MKSILDPSFRYTSSANTDLRKTFARVRRELRKQDPKGAPVATHDASNNVSSMFERGGRTPRNIVAR